MFFCIHGQRATLPYNDINNTANSSSFFNSAYPLRALT